LAKTTPGPERDCVIAQIDFRAPPQSGQRALVELRRPPRARAFVVDRSLPISKARAAPWDRNLLMAQANTASRKKTRIISEIGRLWNRAGPGTHELGIETSVQLGRCDDRIADAALRLCKAAAFFLKGPTRPIFFFYNVGDGRTSVADEDRFTKFRTRVNFEKGKALRD